MRVAGILFFVGLCLLHQVSGSGGVLGCFFCCCQSEDDGCQDTLGPVPNPDWRGCNALPPSGQKWACEDENLDFPTVDCIVQDLKTCGLLNNGANTVFYSFGADVKKVRLDVRDKLNPQGVMFNDGLMSEQNWSPKVLGNARYHMGDPTRVTDTTKSSLYMDRMDIFVARYSEALAKASTNDVYLVYAQEVGKGTTDGGLGGIYQLAPEADAAELTPKPNAWRTWEFPTIQRNAAVKHIYGVDQSENSPLTNIEWTIDTNQKVLPESYAASLELPPLSGGTSAKFRKAKREELPFCTTSSTSTTSEVTTPPPPKCTYVGPEPPTIPKAYCTCDGQSSLPLTTLTTNAPVTDSCAYTAQPTGTAASNPNPMVEPTTYLDQCEVCTPYAENEDDCTTIPQRTTKPTATPTSNPVQVLKGAATVEGGSSAINVGTLTSDALYTSVSSALESLCPPVTQTTDFTHCATQAAKIKGISYVAEDSLLLDGELLVSVRSSQYNQTSLRDALIQSTAITAKFSTSEKNSYNTSYIVENLKRRWWQAPSHTARSLLGLRPRDHPYPTVEHITLYRAIDFAGAHYYTPFINVNNVNDGTDYIDVDFGFQAGSGADLLCDFAEALIDGLAVVAPEFAVQDIELGQAIDFLCKDSIGTRDWKQNATMYGPQAIGQQSDG